MVNKQWLLASRPVGLFKPTDFTWAESPVREPGDGEVLIRVTYLSLDPTNRGWTSEADSYLPPVGIGEVMRGIAIGVVERSRHEGLVAGDLVSGLLGWQQFAVVNGRSVSKLPTLPGVSPTAFLGILGHIGLTAYFGLLDVGRPQPGETLVVTGAAGAVGSLVGQIGKIVGCRVVGVAGTNAKCDWIAHELGFDGAINYKAEPVPARLRRLCPEGIDIDFENVGGPLLEMILNQINLRARVVLCGLISQYNATTVQPGPRNLYKLIIKRARMEGFLVSDYGARAKEAFAQLGSWAAEGRIKFREEIVDGLEHAPSAVNTLFDGSNSGKLIVKVS